MKRYVKTFNESKVLESNIPNNSVIINIDIQPEYEDGIPFSLYEWANFLNENNNKHEIVFLYNGEDTLGMININDYKEWLLHLDVNEEVIEKATFYDKGYAFFRYCIDESIDEQDIVDLVQFLYINDINDSREMDEDMWNVFTKKYNIQTGEIRDLLEYSDDCINVPDLMLFLKKYNTDKLVLMGGHVDECLKEVEIALKALEKKYSIYQDYTY